MNRLVASGLVTLVLAAAPAMAADESAEVTPSVGTMLAAASAADLDVTQRMAIEMTQRPPVSAPKTPASAYRRESRPFALAPLYASSVALQVWDTYSTMTGLSKGAVEINPVMAVATQHPAVFIGLKSAITALSIYQSEKMWKAHHRVAAIAFMIGSNSLMAVVGANNHNTLQQLK